MKDYDAEVRRLIGNTQDTGMYNCCWDLLLFRDLLPTCNESNIDLELLMEYVHDCVGDFVKRVIIYYHTLFHDINKFALFTDLLPKLCDDEIPERLEFQKSLGIKGGYYYEKSNLSKWNYERGYGYNDDYHCLCELNDDILKVCIDVCDATIDIFKKYGDSIDLEELLGERWYDAVTEFKRLNCKNYCIDMYEYFKSLISLGGVRKGFVRLVLSIQFKFHSKLLVSELYYKGELMGYRVSTAGLYYDDKDEIGRPRDKIVGRYEVGIDVGKSLGKALSRHILKGRTLIKGDRIDLKLSENGLVSDYDESFIIEIRNAEELVNFTAEPMRIANFGNKRYSRI